MASAIVASLIAVLVLGFVESLGRFYPALQTWRRLRMVNGNRAVRKMRERFETAAGSKTPRQLALVMMILVVIWIATASLLDKRWYEVVYDVLPYVIVSVALVRTPPAMRKIAARMKDYERNAGWEPDDETGDGGPTALAL